MGGLRSIKIEVGASNLFVGVSKLVKKPGKETIVPIEPQNESV